MARAFDPTLYLVTDPLLLGLRPLERVVEEAVAGGVTLVQLRDKSASTRHFVRQSRALLSLLRPRGIPLLINDRVDVAAVAGADGVHLGSDDLSPQEARRFLGPEALIGWTVESWDDVVGRDWAGIDYLGASVFASATKSNTASVFGLDGLRRLTQATPRPVVAIGGIGIDNAAEVAATGAAGIAVVTAILAAPEPAVAARSLRSAFSSGSRRSR